MTGYLGRLSRRLRDAYIHFSRDGGPIMAAAMAYYLALSFFPLLLVLVAGLGLVLKSTTAGQDAQHRLLAAIEQQSSPALSDQIGRALEGVSTRAPRSGPIGFLALLAAAIAIFAQFDAAFDRIWNVPSHQDWHWWEWITNTVFRRLKALLMLLGAGAFVMAVMITSVVWSAVQSAVEPTVEFSPTIRWLTGLSINIALNLLAFAVIYRFIPKAKVYWLEALRGAAVAAVLWEIGRQLVAVYLLRLSYPTAYGVIGSFMVIMLWAYYAMLVVFFGAEFTRVLRDERRAAKAAAKAAGK